MERKQRKPAVYIVKAREMIVDPQTGEVIAFPGPIDIETFGRVVDLDYKDGYALLEWEQVFD